MENFGGRCGNVMSVCQTSAIQPLLAAQQDDLRVLVIQLRQVRMDLDLTEPGREGSVRVRREELLGQEDHLVRWRDSDHGADADLQLPLGDPAGHPPHGESRRAHRVSLGLRCHRQQRPLRPDEAAIRQLRQAWYLNSHGTPSATAPKAPKV